MDKEILLAALEASDLLTELIANYIRAPNDAQAKVYVMDGLKDVRFWLKQVQELNERP